MHIFIHLDYISVYKNRPQKQITVVDYCTVIILISRSGIKNTHRISLCDTATLHYKEKTIKTQLENIESLFAAHVQLYCSFFFYM